MKALTLRHPWPCAVAHWGKDIENRTWKPYPGQLVPGQWFAIHGGVGPRGKAAREATVDLRRLRLAKLAPANIELAPTILAGIVAVCRFGGTVTDRCSSQWFNGPVGWVLAETVVLAEPVPCRGAQGLWDLPEDVLALVRNRFALARNPKETPA